MILTTTGIITDEQVLKNNVYKYYIKDTEGNEKRYTYFGKNNVGLTMSRMVTVKYRKEQDEKYGEQNKIIECEYGDIVTNVNVIRKTLEKQIGLSSTFSEKIVKMYKEKSMEIIINDTNKIRLIVHRGLEKQMNKIMEFLKDVGKRNFVKGLSDLGIKPRYFDAIEKEFNYDIDQIKKNIYDLYFRCSISFKEVDNIAINVLGYDLNNEYRINALIKMIYEKEDNKGKLYLEADDINNYSMEFKIDVVNILKKINEVELNGEKYYTTKQIYDRERAIENICRGMNKTSVRDDIIYDEEYYKEKFLLTEKQKEGIKKAIEKNVSIITGPPGTGKSYIILNIAEDLCNFYEIYLLAPTGAAVERLRNVDKMKNYCKDVCTIHSFIASREKANGMKTYGEKNDELNKNLVVIIDEMSMVDMSLFYNLLISVTEKNELQKLILIGDVNQLPSIGGGDILNNMISCNLFEVTTLSKIHRQKQMNIINNAILALNGEDIKPDGVDVKLIKIESSEEVENKLIEYVTKNEVINYKNSCVLIPQRGKGVCTSKMNPILQKMHNESNEDNESEYWKNDIIIQLKNDKEKGIFNGSILVVDKVIVDKVNKYVNNTVYAKYYPSETNFSGDYKTIKFDKTDQADIDLAYAMTVHKAQGKGYDYVIIVIHSTMNHQILNRNLFYTAITRAKEKCIIIADTKGLNMCKNKLRERITTLFKPHIRLDQNLSSQVNVVKSNNLDNLSTMEKLHTEFMISHEKYLEEMSSMKIDSMFKEKAKSPKIINSRKVIEI